MSKVQVGINGFGRIGRITFRAIMENFADQLEVKAINDLTSVETNAHLLRHDTNYGNFPGTVETKENALVVKGQEIAITAQKDPGQLPWGDLGVDVVLECTGFFTDAEKAAAHLKAGAKKVIISAPAKGDVQTIVLGVNEQTYDGSANILSNASCTTNCLAPMAKAIMNLYGLEQGFMTTIHSYTNDQRTADQVHSDLRRARAAAANMIPTSTGAAKAIGLVIPELKGKMDGVAIRVPTPTVSVVDLVCETTKPLPELSQIMAEIKAQENEPYLGVTTEELVSSDFIGDSRSSVIDLPLTMKMGEKTLKVFSWYDNEWGYSNRLAELCKFVADKM
ncbi:MAG: type I glyceraldehyde-3-phosphate dehydrogenase [Armatimonadetes bacterium]|nr:type I glyceraldehyde-3-phosphate dehydrogenase [Armatimonadota bacterium]